MNTNNNLVAISNQEFEDFQTITSENVLAPGYYWRLKNDYQVSDSTRPNYAPQLRGGDVHLLIDIFEHDGAPHTAIVLCHPRNGAGTEYRILIADFLANFEPEKNADAVRTQEQTKVMESIQTIQDEMECAQTNPLALPGMKDAIDKAVERFEQTMVAEVAASHKDQASRTADLRKLHRRAARRSTAAGNPLVVRSVTVSDQVGHLIDGGINSEGLQDLTIEAKRRIVIAETTSTWLTRRATQMSDTLQSLAPYYAEKGQVAMARAKKAINYVQKVTQGLTSLKLYTGDGVDVHTVTEGVSALSVEPLTLVQGKRYMDEELAVWADVEDSFDWSSQSQFFEALKTNASLVNQLFATQRCVVSMAVTRRTINYGEAISSYEMAMNNIRNRSVFLLVRDGENIHAVYSSEPSHESTHRLFPTQSEVEHPFKGIDGSTIGLQDVAFGKSVERFDDIALHYKRFLILLCGLDHRLKLFGEFYPQEAGMQFMSLAFQQSYFNFLEDDDASRLIGDDLEPVDDWIDRCNKAVRSGSRVVISSGTGLANSSPQLKRLKSMTLSMNQLPSQLIVTRAKDNHHITVPVSNQQTGDTGTANVWLDGPDTDPRLHWFLCLDLVRLESVQRYVYSRISRIASISWLRTLKRAEALLLTERENQRDLRSALAQAALENGILMPDEIDEAIEVALATWRAACRGADAPSIKDTKAVHEILTLMYPSDRIAQSTEQWINDLICDLGAIPLVLSRTGKNKLVLYVEANEQDKEPYAKGVHWGWVKRVVIDVLKTKVSVSATSLVWLEKSKPNAAEIVVREWPELAKNCHDYPQPCPLKWLENAKTKMAQTHALLGDILQRGRASVCQTGIDEDVHFEMSRHARRVFSLATYYKQIRMALPIGVIQSSPKNPVLFLYAIASASKFVHHYGTPKQWADYSAEVFGAGSKFKNRSLEGELKWRPIVTTEPFKTLIIESSDSFKTPSGIQIESHKPGGYSKRQRRTSFYNPTTRAQRRANNGMPRHESMDLTLSWNRAIETILGLAPHLRRDFYVNQRKWSPKSDPNPMYQPQKIQYYLSPLIWDEGRGRSMANRYFSVQKRNAAAE